MIRVNGISKAFGAVQAVSDMHFTAADGAITTLLGANGSGKTTTLRAVSGLLTPDSGQVLVDGHVMATDTLAAQARLGVFPDNFGLYARLTTREHLAYFARLHGMGGSDLDAAIEHVVALLEISDIVDRRTEGFSSGQRMKVALARAIIHRPRNIVLDEPTRGLDVMSIRLLRRILSDLRDAGHCILLSSHVMAEVQRLSDHVVMMAAGRKCAEGSPDELVRESGEPDLEEAFVAFSRAAAGADSGPENRAAKEESRA
ncbi:ABC transporter ATP-binding protein [Yunchengibacter salinarum]|uniref:ABC transporter ATP-binding protein n=1 Tax=Yunchengibacter salinarum TaxID=3133399 RepID=UPI0035B61F19